MKRWVKTVPLIPVTNNTREGWKHWAHRYGDSKKWRLAIRVACGMRSRRPLRRVCLTIVVYRTRLQDRDNFWGSLKPVVDGLKHNRWIRDDDHEWVELSPESKEVKAKKEDLRTEITWELLDARPGS
jgi:hypothetical protein